MNEINTDITRFNNKYLKCIVTKYLSTIDYLGNSGSLIVYQPGSNSQINKNYVYLGNEFLASGYGFSNETTQIKAEKIVNKYDNDINSLKQKDQTLNEKIEYDVNNLAKNVETYYVKKKGGPIGETTININGYDILTKNIILYGEEAQYKNLEILDVKIRINNNEAIDNDIFLPVGYLIKEITVIIKFRKNDSGGLDKLYIEHKNINDNETIIVKYDDVRNVLDSSDEYGTITYVRSLEENEQIYVNKYLEDIISKCYIYVKGTPQLSYKNYPGLEKNFGIKIPSSGNAIKDNVIELINHINVRPQFYLHYGFNYDEEIYKHNISLNSFNDYDKTTVILENIDTKHEDDTYFTEIYIAIPSVFSVQKIYVIQNNSEKFNWTGTVKVQKNINMISYKNIVNTENNCIYYNVYKLTSAAGGFDQYNGNDIKIELDIMYNLKKDPQIIDGEYNISFSTYEELTEFTSNELLNDEDFNNLYWVNGNININNSFDHLTNKLNNCGKNGNKQI